MSESILTDAVLGVKLRENAALSIPDEYLPPEARDATEEYWEWLIQQYVGA